MTDYLFAIPLQADLARAVDDQLARHARGDAADTKSTVAVAIGTNDAITQALVLDIVDILRGGEGAGLLGFLAGLLEKTMHGLIRLIMGSIDADEQRKLAGYLTSRRIMDGDQMRFGFALPAALGARFQAHLAQVSEGQLSGVREALTRDMGEFVDLAISKFYDDFTSCMTVGFVKRKMIDTGRSTIQKAGHSTVQKLFTQMSDEELKKAVIHYGTLFITRAG